MQKNEVAKISPQNDNETVTTNIIHSTNMLNGNESKNDGRNEDRFPAHSQPTPDWQLKSSFGGLHISNKERQILPVATCKEADLPKLSKNKGVRNTNPLEIKPDLESIIVVTEETSLLSEDIEVSQDLIRQTFSTVPVETLQDKIPQNLQVYSKLPSDGEKSKEKGKGETNQFLTEIEYIKHTIPSNDLAVRRAKELDSHSLQLHLGSTKAIRQNNADITKRMLEDNEDILLSLECSAIIDVPFLEKDAFGSIFVHVTSKNRVLIVQAAEDVRMDFEEQESHSLKKNKTGKQIEKSLHHKAQISRNFRGIQLAFFLDDIDLAWASENVETNLYSEFRHESSKHSERKVCCKGCCKCNICCMCIYCCKCCLKCLRCGCCKSDCCSVKETEEGAQRLIKFSKDSLKENFGKVFIDGLYSNDEESKAPYTKEQKMELFLHILFKEKFPYPRRKTVLVLDEKQDILPVADLVSKIQCSTRTRTILEEKQLLKSSNAGDGVTQSFVIERAEKHEGASNNEFLGGSSGKRSFAHYGSSKKERSAWGNDYKWSSLPFGKNCTRRRMCCLIVTIVIIIIIIAAAAS